jgi:hypothetical protein
MEVVRARMVAMDDDEAAVRSVGDWLMAQGIVGWGIDEPEPGQRIELQLYWENREHAERIRRHFGDALVVTVLPEDAPRMGI